MHVDELDIDGDLVRRLMMAQFPRWAKLTLTPVVSAGTVNALYRLGDDMVVRLPRVERAKGGVEHEHEWIPRLSPLLPVAIPSLLGQGTPGEGYPLPWSVFGWIEGDNPTPEDLVAPELLATDVAGFIAALRQIDTIGAPPAYRGGSLITRDGEVRTWIRNLQGAVDTDAVMDVWEKSLQAPAWRRPPVWVHSDLLPGNLLLSKGRLIGVIDFAASGVGDPACDLIVAWNLLPPSARSAFRAALGADDATWARGRGWALSMGLGALSYYRETNAVMATNGLHVIQEVLADHQRNG
ncbi:MAG TPA: aminoglycoside phosphotransferase family protein [Actinomycetota bacterium]|jgi:aminoglycoside phosphotransferase (APT) family kinase protein|nr:aminoglycoside phosphotransferase family protein [Actinomycetota bacterium]